MMNHENDVSSASSQATEENNWVPDSYSDSDSDPHSKTHHFTSSDAERESETSEANNVKIENDFNKYPCTICEKIYDSYANLREHKKKHFVKKRTCNICNLVCQSIGRLEVHMNTHTGLKPCVCDECGKSYASTTQLKIHKRIHTDEKRYKCKDCDQAFRYNGTLKSHIRINHTNIMENTCKVCSKYCTTPDGLKAHMSELHSKSNKPIKCQLCEKVFKTEPALSCHLKIHTELKFPCEFCQRIYATLYLLKKHVGRAHIPNICECKKVFYDRSEFTKHNKEFHKSEDSTKCKFCGKVFDKLKNLTEHVRLQHKDNGKVNKCDICEKEFINSSLLRNHVKIHDKTFKCDYCNKIFGSRYNLQVHSVVHTKERKYKCETCGNCFGTKNALKNHQYTHLEELNYACEICLKKFKSNRRLYAHKASHETEKRYQCDVCNARFTVKQYLNFHMKKHSNIKPFTCHPCNKKFKHKRSWEKHCLLNRHKTAVSKYEKWQCDFCDIITTSEELLTEHMNEDHRSNSVCELNDVKMEETFVKVEADSQ